MKVVKFGGSSVAHPEGLARVVEIVRTARAEGPVVVVVSALGGVTDDLEEACRRAARRDETWRELHAALLERHCATARTAAPGADLQPFIRERFADLEDLLHGVHLLREASPRTRDGVLSYGERLSAPLVAAALTAAGTEAKAHDSRTLIVTDDHFGAARVDTEATYERLRREMGDGAEDRPVAVLGGFLGATPGGETTTLGRGGSDLTAALLGAALGASAVELWTDVAGVMSADPRRVPDAFPLPYLSYAELMELSHFGAKVVYPPTVHPARAAGVPLVIKSTFEPDAPGTRVESDAPPSEHPVRAIASVHRVALLRLEGDGMVGVPGIAQRLFGALAREQVSVILISQASSEHSICFAVAPGEADRARASVDAEFTLERRAGLIEDLVVEEDLAILAVVGEGMREQAGLAGRLFGILGDHRINVRAIAQGSSERNVSVVVAGDDEARALRAVHGAFFAPRRRRIEVAVAGAGGVATAFFEELRALAEQDDGTGATPQVLPVAVWNRSRLAVAEAGEALDPAGWQEQLQVGRERGRDGEDDLGAVLDRLAAGPAGTSSPNATGVLVDLTASPAMDELYRGALERGVAVVAANKIPFAGPLSSYRDLLARTGAAPLLHEATVGAGLPVLTTLEELRRTGDRIDAIEGLLSGTLNFVLDRLLAGMAFSQAVREAHSHGLTEPHPAEDLSGADVVRKLVILGRCAGDDLEADAVANEPLLPTRGDGRAWQALPLEEFFAEIEALDALWAERAAKAKSDGRRLRHLARWARRDDGSREATVAVTAVGPDHPTFDVAVADNLVAFTTARYRETPLVIRGPGAGPRVTAAGVLGDVLRVGR